MPAVDAGLEIEDVITAIDGIQMTSVEQLQAYTRDHEGEEMQVTVLRRSEDGNNVEELTIPVTPRKKDGEILMGISITGVYPSIIGLTAVNQNVETHTRALGPGEAVKTGWDEFASTFKVLGDFFSDLVHGRLTWNEARPVSPVGIGQIGGPILEQSLDENTMYPIVFFAAMISIALALTNILPIPGLDGGRIVFVIIELIRGKPLSPEREGLVHFIGLLLLLAIIAATLVNDIVNPIDLTGLR
jgi:regulator of sigma E protease